MDRHKVEILKIFSKKLQEIIVLIYTARILSFTSEVDYYYYCGFVVKFSNNKIS